MNIKTGRELAERATAVAKHYKTLYVMGCFGAPLNEKNKVRYINQNAYNRSPLRKNMIRYASEDTFGFDCVCLIKGLLWGWNGNKSDVYGGAKYCTNGIPDISADSMIQQCKDISTDFTNIEVGEVVWTNGHIGIYIGNGLAVECSPSWANKVQITACNRKKDRYQTRIWKKHGKLPYISYGQKLNDTRKTLKKSNVEVAKEVLKGLWGNGKERERRLTDSGYDYVDVQSKVNELLK